MPNRHPVDELAALRAERRRLGTLEEALRIRLLMANADLEGAEYRAIVNTFTPQELDYDKLTLHFGRAVINSCTRAVPYRVISLHKHPRQRRAPTQIETIEAPT